jgi:hypothetical protein
VSRRLRTDDPTVLNLNYRIYIEPLALYPYTNLTDLRANLMDLAESNPRLKDVNLATFVDNSFIQRAQQR